MKNTLIVVLIFLLATISVHGQGDSELYNEYSDAQKEVKKVLDEIEKASEKIRPIN